MSLQCHPSHTDPVRHAASEDRQKEKDEQVQGVVRFVVRGFNQNDEVVALCENARREESSCLSGT